MNVTGNKIAWQLYVDFVSVQWWSEYQVTCNLDKFQKSHVSRIWNLPAFNLKYKLYSTTWGYVTVFACLLRKHFLMNVTDTSVSCAAVSYILRVKWLHESKLLFEPDFHVSIQYFGYCRSPQLIFCLPFYIFRWIVL